MVEKARPLEGRTIAMLATDGVPAFVEHFFDHDKPVAAICHAPWVLIEAGVVKGRPLTSWPSLRTDIENAGGRWIDREVQIDGRLVTSRKPDDLDASCLASVEMIEQYDPAGSPC